MPIWHIDTGRKPTGGKIRIGRKKKKYERGSPTVHTRMGKEKREKFRARGGGLKIKAFSVEFANVFDQEKKITKKVKIIDVLENPANPQLVRSKIITKGCIIETELGKARVTSRPSQDGVVNAVLLKEKS